MHEWETRERVCEDLSRPFESSTKLEHPSQRNLEHPTTSSGRDGLVTSGLLLRVEKGQLEVAHGGKRIVGLA